jgi:septal ring factor EnvC (AmiA/AmiB activator)
MQESIEQQSNAYVFRSTRTQGMAERLHDSNGVLNDDRIRNTIIENHRRTTATITATTSAIAEATASFRHNANQNYPSLVSTIKGNRERSAKLTASTKSLATIQKQFHELERSTASYTEQINGKVREMSQITANNEEVLERISTTQHSVSSEVAKAQQNLLETSEILKKISSR